MKRLGLSYKPVIFVIILVLVVLYGLYYFGLFKKDCEQDIECFNKALGRCDYAKFEGISNDNFYKYTVNGIDSNSCVLDIELKKSAFGTTVEIVQKFEGKNMDCNIPLSRLESVNVNNFKDLINFCTGPLKEAILEQIVIKMYALIIQNLGDIIGTVEKDLYKVS